MEGLSPCARCTVTTTRRTISSDNVVNGVSRGHFNICVNTNVNNLRAFIGGAINVRGKNPEGISPFFVPVVVNGVTANGITVHFGTGNISLSIVDTYTANAGSVNRTFRYVGSNCTSTVVTNNTRTIITPLAVTNFRGVGTLSAGSSPGRTSHPFSGGHSNFVVNRNTNVLILRRCRRTITENTGVCTRLSNCNGAYSTRRIATPSPGNTNLTETVGVTFRRTGITSSTRLCVGTRNADARLGSLARAVTVGATLNRGTCSTGVDSAGSVANRLLNTANTIRTVTSIVTLGSNVVPPAVGLSRPSRNLSLGCAPGGTIGHSMGITTSAGLNFNKRSTYLMFGGCWTERLL